MAVKDMMGLQEGEGRVAGPAVWAVTSKGVHAIASVPVAQLYTTAADQQTSGHPFPSALTHATQHPACHPALSHR